MACNNTHTHTHTHTDRQPNPACLRISQRHPIIGLINPQYFLALYKQRSASTQAPQAPQVSSEEANSPGVFSPKVHSKFRFKSRFRFNSSIHFRASTSHLPHTAYSIHAYTTRSVQGPSNSNTIAPPQVSYLTLLCFALPCLALTLPYLCPTLPDPFLTSSLPSTLHLTTLPPYHLTFTPNHSSILHLPSSPANSPFLHNLAILEISPNREK